MINVYNASFEYEINMKFYFIYIKIFRFSVKNMYAVKKFFFLFFSIINKNYVLILIFVKCLF